MNLAKPKSHTFTSKLWLIKILWLLISLWTIPRLCIYSNTTAASLAIYNFCLILISIVYFFMWSKSKREPGETCSNTIYISGICGITPISIVTFGCLKILCITISFYISYNKSSVSRGSNIFFIATGVPFSFPLWIVEKPPCPIFSPTSISFSVISLTPETEGNFPSEAVTF